MEDIKIGEDFQESATEWISMESGKEIIFYRRYKMNSLQWNSYIIGKAGVGEFDLESSLLACGRNGGCIAVVKRKGDFVEGGTNMLRDHLIVFDACGVHKATIAVVLNSP